MFITVFTWVLHWSRFWATRIQSMPSHPIPIRSILILSRCRGVTIDGIWTWSTRIRRYRLFFILYKSLHAAFSVCFTSRFLVTDLINEDSPHSVVTSLLSGEYPATGLTQSKSSQSYVTIDGQSASLFWYKAPMWGLRPYLYFCRTVVGCLIWGALSDKRTGLSFARVTVSSNKPVVSMYNCTLVDDRLPHLRGKSKAYYGPLIYDTVPFYNKT
jgi:hypothetical protein